MTASEISLAGYRLRSCLRVAATEALSPEQRARLEQLPELPEGWAGDGSYGPLPAAELGALLDALRRERLHHAVWLSFEWAVADAQVAR